MHEIACPAKNNVNDVVRTVLNFLFFYLLYFFFFYKKISHAPRFRMHKSTKAQRRNQAKAQNAKRTKIKNALKKHLRGRKVTYLLICVFVLFVRAKKKE